jgi:hypothetical protein
VQSHRRTSSRTGVLTRVFTGKHLLHDLQASNGLEPYHITGRSGTFSEHPGRSYSST